MHPSILESAARPTQVRFPWIPHKNEPPGHRSYRCPPLGNHTTMNHTILVIHDDPAALARIGARLERGGHDVRRARSAAEARRVILEEDPGIILTPVLLLQTTMSGHSGCNGAKTFSKFQHSTFGDFSFR